MRAVHKAKLNPCRAFLFKLNLFPFVITFLLCLSALSQAETAPWIEVVSENFVVYTDTDRRTAVSLLRDLESRYSAFSSVFFPIDSRQFPIRVFLMDTKQEYLNSLPESVLRTTGDMIGKPHFVA